MLAAAEACFRALERRLATGLHLNVASVLSVFVSRWDVAVSKQMPQPFHNRLGIAVAMRCYRAYCSLMASERWHRLAAAGAQLPRLLWASTGSKDPAVTDTFYVQALAAPNTINTLPEQTLLAFADHGRVERVLPIDGGNAEAVIAEFRRAGLDDSALAARLQRDGVLSFAKSWQDLLKCVRDRRRGKSDAE